MKVVVFSLGCKVNQYEGRSLISKLNADGHNAVEELEWADLYIINTCSVTSEADKKSRQAVARVLKLNPNAKIIICGCSSQNDVKQYKNKPNIVLIGGTSDKMELINSTMSDIMRQNSPQIVVKEPPKEYEDDLIGEVTKTRGYLKVQDGCDNFCSYCIIPYLRGRSRSRSLQSIQNEAEEMAKQTNELVITGINVSDYGKNIGASLIDLVGILGKINVRKRFGSLECNVINEQLLCEMQRANFCDSFHLSLQSGSDNVLKKMNRKYTAQQFIEKVKLIKKFFPNAGITTDIIVGFPTENEDDFNETLSLCEKVEFSQIHSFVYSARQGTIASKLKPLDGNVLDERAKRLKAVAVELRNKFIKTQEGKECTIYPEDESDGYMVGYTSNYLKVYIPNGNYNKEVQCRILTKYRDGVKGEIIV